MSPEKRAKPESLDFVLAAIAPIFIIGMIGSLVYFLITVAYQGSYTVRLKWILGLYTLATVLIARIAIEQSRQLAFAYMFALAAATLIVTPQFFVISGAAAFFSFPVLVFILVMVAFLADRITFDCTSMNEQMQSTGVGLLQSLGLVQSERKQSNKQNPLLAKEEPSKSAEGTKSTALKRKHNPGVWVLYFALFALPLFGLGQLTIQSPTDRSLAFSYLFVYLLSSFFLLVLISLLSLRKYLRERGVPMETSFAVRWLAIGMSSVLIVLSVLSLLPIPGHSLLSMELPFRITSRDDLKANKWGWGREGAEGDGPQQGEGDAQDKPGGTIDGKGPDEGGEKAGNKQKAGKPNGENKSGEGDQKGGDSQKGESDPNNDRKQTEGPEKKGENDPNRNGSDGKSDNQSQESDKQPKAEDENKSNTEKQDRRSSDEKKNTEGNQQPLPSDEPKKVDAEKQNKDQQGNDKKPPPENKAEGNPPQPPPTPQTLSIQWNLSALVQWLLMIALAIAALVYGLIYRKELLAAFKSFRDWLSSLFGGRKNLPTPKNQSIEDPSLLEDLYPPFHTFANPFASGNGWSREQVVRHMYRAMLSWGYEHRIVRREDETPEEFMRRLLRRFPEQQESFAMLGTLYNRIAYARGKVSVTELKPMPDFWQWLVKKSEAASV